MNDLSIAEVYDMSISKFDEYIDLYTNSPYACKILSFYEKFCSKTVDLAYDLTKSIKTNLIIFKNFSKDYLTNKLSEYLLEKHEKYWVLHYPHGLKWYKIILPKKSKPLQYYKIINEFNEDVTENISGFLNHSEILESLGVTPNLLGYKSLKFYDYDENVKEFTENDKIFLD